MNSVALEVRGIKKKYKLPQKKIDVLRGVDLSVDVGQWILLTGQSGCGKTTLLYILGTLDSPDSGTIHCFGQSVCQMSSYEKSRLRRVRLGFVFQSYHLFPELSSVENVMLPGRLTHIDLKSLKNRAAQLLAELGMGDRLNHRPAELSGGEQQRIAIARALMNEPDIVLADEPTGNLDDKNTHEIMDILSKLQNEKNKTIIMVSHDQKLAKFADISYTLQDGQLINSTLAD